MPKETLRPFVVEQVLSCINQKHSQVSLSKPSKFPKDQGVLVRSWVTHRMVTLGERSKGVTALQKLGICWCIFWNLCSGRNCSIVIRVGKYPTELFTASVFLFFFPFFFFAAEMHVLYFGFRWIRGQSLTFRSLLSSSLQR